MTSEQRVLEHFPDATPQYFEPTFELGNPNPTRAGYWIIAMDPLGGDTLGEGGALEAAWDNATERCPRDVDDLGTD